MTSSTIMFLATACSAAQAPPSAPPASQPALKLEATIELPDVKGRIDHLAITRDGARLFVAALENDSLEVVDLKAEKHERSLPKAGAPAGVATFGDPERVAFACGTTGKLEVLDARTLEKVASVDVGDDADNVRWDARHHRVIVAYGSGGLAIVDAEAWKVTGRIELGAHPEAFQLDAAGQRAFVNLPDRHSVALVELPDVLPNAGVASSPQPASGRVAATIELEEVQGNFPMLWLEKRGVVVLGCRHPGRLLFVDAGEKKVMREHGLTGELNEVLLAKDVDDLFHDLARDRIYASCGEGVVDVFERTPETDAPHGLGWREKEHVATAKGARTCLYSKELDRLFVAAPRRDGGAARILILVPQP